MTISSLFALPYSFIPGIFPIVLVFWLFFHFRPSLRRKLHYPPGPPEKSIISGNLSDLPAKAPWHTYAAWGEEYGTVIHARAFNNHLIILNSYKANWDLLEKRSVIYSDRPSLPMMDLMGWSCVNIAFMGYNSAWRAHRRIFQQYFKHDASLKYRPIQSQKVNDFLFNLLTSPKDFMRHYRTLPGAIIMSTVYGHDVGPKDDFYVVLAERALGMLARAFFPGASLFNVFPLLRFLPTWLPGAGFKRFALEGRKAAFEMRDIPIGLVQTQMNEGRAPNCIAAELLEMCKSKEQYDIITGVAASTYVAGSDTTASSLGTFFQAMLMSPEAQLNAQEEIDTVVGLKRMVNFDDRPSLPYVEALYWEVMRWRPVGPCSIFHANSADDVYNGYYIPKGATIISNLWAIAHDSAKYHNPDKFDPSRFFDDNGELNKDEVGFIFGFGRRRCPGRHMAATIWLTIATVLQNFNIQKKIDAEGNEVPVSGEYTDGGVIHPLPFECSIHPRSTESQTLILRTVGNLE